MSAHHTAENRVDRHGRAVGCGWAVTLKAARRRGNSVALEPANRAYETRIFGPDRVRVQGRLIGLLRKY